MTSEAEVRTTVALERIADALEGIRTHLEAGTQRHGVISQMPAIPEGLPTRLSKSEAGRIGGKRSAEGRQRQPGGTFAAKHNQANTKQTPSKKQPSTQPSKQTDLNLNQPSTHQAPTKQNPTKQTKQVGKSIKVWDSYCTAYKKRYGVEPVRNHTVNSLLCKVVDAVGEVEGVGIAAFYLTHGDRLYVQAKHPANLLLRDWQKLRTEWKTGSKTTTGQAAKEEVTESIRSTFARFEQRQRAKAEQAAKEFADEPIIPEVEF